MLHVPSWFAHQGLFTLACAAGAFSERAKAATRAGKSSPGEEEASSPFLVRARVSSKFLGTFTRAILLRNLSRDGNYN